MLIKQALYAKPWTGIEKYINKFKAKAVYGIPRETRREHFSRQGLQKPYIHWCSGRTGKVAGTYLMPTTNISSKLSSKNSRVHCLYLQSRAHRAVQHAKPDIPAHSELTWIDHPLWVLTHSPENESSLSPFFPGSSVLVDELGSNSLRQLRST